jgi:hypothetical protein
VRDGFELPSAVAGADGFGQVLAGFLAVVGVGEGEGGEEEKKRCLFHRERVKRGGWFWQCGF